MTISNQILVTRGEICSEVGTFVWSIVNVEGLILIFNMGTFKFEDHLDQSLILQ